MGHFGNVLNTRRNSLSFLLLYCRWLVGPTFLLLLCALTWDWSKRRHHPGPFVLYRGSRKHHSKYTWKPVSGMKSHLAWSFPPPQIYQKWTWGCALRNEVRVHHSFPPLLHLTSSCSSQLRLFFSFRTASQLPAVQSQCPLLYFSFSLYLLLSYASLLSRLEIPWSLLRYILSPLPNILK